jgi:hypothetical protein
MLGLMGMIVVQFALVCLLSYWIAWEMQHKETRSAFRTQAWNDLVNLLRKYRASIQIPGLKLPAGTAVRVAPEERRRSLEAPVLSRKAVASRS